MKPNEVLTTQQRDDVLQRSDVKAWVAVMSAWTLTLITLMLVGHFPGFLTLALAWIVLPGRQLSLAVLMHEAGHGSLFKTRALNRWVGEWLCALPVLSDFDAYARGHQIHHRLAGTADDPDLPNYHTYPISKASLKRKWFRDLTGQTGFKVLQTLARGTASQMSPPPQSRYISAPSNAPSRSATAGLEAGGSDIRQMALAGSGNNGATFPISCQSVFELWE